MKQGLQRLLSSFLRSEGKFRYCRLPLFKMAHAKMKKVGVGTIASTEALVVKTNEQNPAIFYLVEVVIIGIPINLYGNINKPRSGRSKIIVETFKLSRLKP